MPDLIVFLQCTSPVRSPEDIDQAIQTLERDNADSLFSACRNDKFIWRLRNDVPVPLNYDPAARPREQDCPIEFRENGSLYLFKPWVLEQKQCRMGGKLAVYEMGFWSSFQLDTQEDLQLLEWIMKEKPSESALCLNRMQGDH